MNTQDRMTTFSLEPLTITHMGGMGDGIAHYEGKPVFIPFTCVGDEIRATITHESKDVMRGEMLELLAPSPDRQPSPCLHFSICGGCALQHLAPAPYAAFKYQQMVHMLDGLGVEPSVLYPMISVGAESRRRTELKVTVNKGAISLGFLQEKTHTVVDVQICPVLEPALMAVIAPIKIQLAAMKKPSSIMAVQLTALDAGVDMMLCVRGALKPVDLEAWVAFAKTQSIIRLALQIEGGHPTLLYDTGGATIRHAEAIVAFPIGAFLQASKRAEAAMVARVTKAVEGCDRVLDLYAGCGTYSFPIAEQAARVVAVEGMAEMVAAVQNALRTYGYEARMEALVRDLFVNPLRASELAAYDAIVINPPRGGALPQVKEITRSGVGIVVMVSCNPATFQRDAAC
jgi:23S rRNA (uracil1939-C5)-methyltransferase